MLEYVLRCNPCPRRSGCREADCFYGHICQKDGCNGLMKGCKMKKDLHNIDPNMVGTAPAEDGFVPAATVEMPEEPNFLW